MSDVLTTTQRSYNMSRIRSEKTGPEIRLRDLLISKGLSDFKMQPQEIPGRPDFYFLNQRTALFVDGCFWHGCKTCFQTPQTNRKFWSSKISSNIVRDGIVNKILSITKDDNYLENSTKQAKVREYEKQIDQLVYKLYGLTPEERRKNTESRKRP